MHFSFIYDIRIRLIMVSEYIHTHSTKLLSPRGCETSTDFCPVTSTNNTTPNENTSDLAVSFPLDAYSGAIYLKYSNQFQENLHFIGSIQTFLVNQSITKINTWEFSKMETSTTYPKVPMTLFVTCVLVSDASFASPKYDTYK